MARMQQWEEREGWREQGEEQRWPEAETRAEQRWPQRVEERDTADDLLPIVNPYSIVALVAALLLLFPVALVFGLISFGYPKGRGMATLALLLGATQAAAVVAFFVLNGSSFTDALPRTDQSVAAQSTAAAPTAAPATLVIPTTVLPTAAPTTTTKPVAATKGSSCTSAQVSTIGQSGDGGTLLCLGVTGNSGSYQWSGPYNVGTGQYDSGSSCDPTISKTGRTADGHALVCEGSGRSGSWVRWTTE